MPVSDPKPWFGGSRVLRPPDAAAGEGLLRASADLCIDGQSFLHLVQGAGATNTLRPGVAGLYRGRLWPRAAHSIPGFDIMGAPSGKANPSPRGLAEPDPEDSEPTDYIAGLYRFCGLERQIRKVLHCIGKLLTNNP